jgi:hypothetical protein
MHRVGIDLIPESPLEILQTIPRLKIKRLQLLSIFLFGIGLIENVIRLIDQVCASDAVTTTSAVVKEIGFHTVLAVVAPQKPITFKAVHAFVTKLVFPSNQHIRGILGGHRLCAITYVLIPTRAEQKVAVLVAVHEVGVIGINGIDNGEREKRAPL